MADELAATRARIHGVQQLDTVIGAMRGIAAAHAQQSRALLPGFLTYADLIAQAIASALRLRDDPPSALVRGTRRARVVFCVEQGFVGGFVERILDEVATRPPAGTARCRRYGRARWHRRSMASPRYVSASPMHCMTLSPPGGSPKSKWRFRFGLLGKA